MTGTILIAEDDRCLRRACDVALRGRGYTTVLAEDGLQALALAASAKPDLVLLDLLMPRMSGIEVLRALRADEATRALPVLIFSNSSATPEVRHATELGVLGYWVKANFSLAGLADGVDRVMTGVRHGAHTARVDR